MGFGQMLSFGTYHAHTSANSRTDMPTMSVMKARHTAMDAQMRATAAAGLAAARLAAATALRSWRHSRRRSVSLLSQVIRRRVTSHSQTYHLRSDVALTNLRKLGNSAEFLCIVHRCI